MKATRLIQSIVLIGMVGNIRLDLRKPSNKGVGHFPEEGLLLEMWSNLDHEGPDQFLHDEVQDGLCSVQAPSIQTGQ